MENINIIIDNYKAENNSFVYYLVKENIFNTDELEKLCRKIKSLDVPDLNVLIMTSSIQNNAMQYITEHLDSSNGIENLPGRFWENMEKLKQSIEEYQKKL